jgi:hypothetical protein
MPADRLRVRAANFAFLLLLPALFLAVVSLTRHLAPGNPFYAALDLVGGPTANPVISGLFTLLTLLGPVGALVLCALAILQLEWRRELGGVVATIRLRDRLVPLLTVGGSLVLLALLMLYALFENFAPR